jgi:hypothetical protein
LPYFAFSDYVTFLSPPFSLDMKIKTPPKLRRNHIHSLNFLIDNTLFKLSYARQLTVYRGSMHTHNRYIRNASFAYTYISLHIHIMCCIVMYIIRLYVIICLYYCVSYLHIVYFVTTFSSGIGVCRDTERLDCLVAHAR